MKTVAGQPINLTLIEDSEMLEEVVVVGYGTMRKKDLTGSVVQINPSKIADQNPTSVQDVLRGTPGLQIGYDASAKGSDASIFATWTEFFRYQCKPNDCIGRYGFLW